MSFDYLHWTQAQYDVPAPDRIVLMILGDFADTKGRIYASRDDLRERLLDMPLDTVDGHLQALIDRGVISWHIEDRPYYQLLI